MKGCTCGNTMQAIANLDEAQYQGDSDLIIWACGKCERIYGELHVNNCNTIWAVPENRVETALLKIENLYAHVHEYLQQPDGITTIKTKLEIIRKSLKGEL